MGTKNNPANRGKAGEAKLYNGKVVKPVLFMGKRKYIAVQYADNGELVFQEGQDEPLMWDSIR